MSGESTSHESTNRDPARTEPTTRDSASEHRTPASGVATLVAAGALAVSIGTMNGGVAAGGGVAGGLASGGLAAPLASGALVLAWALAGPVYAFALGQILFAALAPSPTAAAVGTAQAGLFALLAVPVGRNATLRTVGAFLVASAGLVGVGAGVRDVTGDLWPAALAVALAVALVSYALHRYELVALDLVEADP
ncbi:hypothetical protein [Halorussus caseinilyticus]|uniref:DUF8163 domain-containing protein n=1 Tax=Halorussus caseinilyticus TaxID=3034025 RepID=A0ABD5WKC2_9EURY|nr:hypothetical protein [Halorussus sp. DT72]